MPRSNSFYANGHISDDSPLRPYIKRYQNLGRYQPGLHLVVMEKDLLTLMATRYIDSLGNTPAP